LQLLTHQYRQNKYCTFDIGLKPGNFIFGKLKNSAMA